MSRGFEVEYSISVFGLNFLGWCRRILWTQSSHGLDRHSWKGIYSWVSEQPSFYVHFEMDFPPRAFPLDIMLTYISIVWFLCVFLNITSPSIVFFFLRDCPIHHFQKEKNKKKRGSYRGGIIDMASHSIKFDWEKCFPLGGGGYVPNVSNSFFFWFFLVFCIIFCWGALWIFAGFLGWQQSFSRLVYQCFLGAVMRKNSSAVYLYRKREVVFCYAWSFATSYVPGLNRLNACSQHTPQAHLCEPFFWLVCQWYSKRAIRFNNLGVV